MADNYFQGLYDIDVADKTKIKPKSELRYLPWSSAWAEVKKFDQAANYEIIHDDNNRFWFDDGTSGWVEVRVTIDGITHGEYFPIMDYRNQAIPADKITSVDANKAVKRALTKCCADHGLGLYLYEGEELKEDNSRKTKGEKDLDRARADLVKLCKHRVEEGIDRTKLYNAIKEKNNGNKNPSSVPTVEICAELTKIIKEMK